LTTILEIIIPAFTSFSLTNGSVTLVLDRISSKNSGENPFPLSITEITASLLSLLIIILISPFFSQEFMLFLIKLFNTKEILYSSQKIVSALLFSKVMVIPFFSAAIFCFSKIFPIISSGFTIVLCIDESSSTSL
jgi:uncharacterized protein YacL